MKTKEITITSKNQITIPIDYVRRSKLRKGSRLTVILRNGALVIKPAPTVEQIMAPVWQEMKKYVKKPLNDKELKQAIRESVAHGAERN